MNPLFSRLLETKTDQEVIQFLEDLSKHANLKWRPVGDRENNLATINLGSDPAAGLVERITNAIDAVLDRKWIEAGQPDYIKSPRQASEEWFGFENGKLVGVDLGNKKIREDITKQVIVTLHDSGVDRRPTVDIRDKGIGIKSEDFGSTILSLNEGRKLKKLFLAGAFGQGGSTALSYSNFTIIISRAINLSINSTKPNPVAFTIVRFNEGDINVDKHGLYEYLVDGQHGIPFIIEDVSEEEFPPGTLVRHVTMDLGKYSSPVTVPRGSLWYLANHYMFDPVLPFWIEEKRDNKSKNQGRSVGGNYRRLTSPENHEYHRKAIQKFRKGEVTISWWVLKLDNHDDNKITNFTLPSKPIIITYNGQKQGELPNTIIKNDLKLPYLERYLIVHVDCDKLDNESRRQLFPTTRESLRDTSILDDLRELVIETLDGDDSLYEFDQRIKQRYTHSTDSKAMDNIRKRLANRVKTYISTGSGGDLPNIPSRRGGRTPNLPRPEIPIIDPPTMLEITSANPKKVYPGKNFTITFRTNADPAHFDSDAFIAIIPPSLGKFKGIMNVKKGYGTAYFQINDDVQIGTQSSITLELRPRFSKSLSDSIDIEVVEIPDQGSTNNPGNAKTPNINPQWVGAGSAYWIDNEWDEKAVAQVEQTDDEITVYVSKDNQNLSKLLAKAQRKGEEAVENIKAFYLEHVSFHAVLQHLSEKDKEIGLDVTGAEFIKKKELERVSETICGIITHVFDYILSDTEQRESTYA